MITYELSLILRNMPRVIIEKMFAYEINDCNVSHCRMRSFPR